MHLIIIIFLIKASSRNAIKKKMGTNWGCYCFLFQKKTVNLRLQTHTQIM